MLLALAALLSVSVHQPTNPVGRSGVNICQLTTPNGGRIAFDITRRDGRRAGILLNPVTGSIWPSGAVDGRPEGAMSPSPFPGELFSVRQGEQLYALHVATRPNGLRPATVYAINDPVLSPVVSLPVAFGFCLDRVTSAVRGVETLAWPVATVAENLSPDSWVFDDSCSLLSMNRQQSRLQKTHDPRGTRFSSTVPNLLSAESVLFRGQGLGAAGLAISVSRLFSDGGADVVSMEFVGTGSNDRDIGVTLLQFERFGGTADESRQPGFAICPFRVVRRRSS